MIQASPYLGHKNSLVPAMPSSQDTLRLSRHESIELDAALQRFPPERGLDDAERRVGSKVQRSPTSTTWVIAGVCLACVNILLIAAAVSRLVQGQIAIPINSQSGLVPVRDQHRLIGPFNRYWNGEELEVVEDAWNSISSSHGVVAFSTEFTRAKKLPNSIAHPLEPSKRVYAIEAYHMMHCLKALRNSYVRMLRGLPPARPLEHDLHCFDALRQSIMCQANDQLLIITGHGHERGFNQTIQCRSWDALREFATEHTACYRDSEPPEWGPPRWDNCEGRDDGLPHGSLLR